MEIVSLNIFEEKYLAALALYWLRSTVFTMFLPLILSVRMILATAFSIYMLYTFPPTKLPILSLNSFLAEAVKGFIFCLPIVFISSLGKSLGEMCDALRGGLQANIYNPQSGTTESYLDKLLGDYLFSHFLALGGGLVAFVLLVKSVSIAPLAYNNARLFNINFTSAQAFQETLAIGRALCLVFYLLLPFAIACLAADVILIVSLFLLAKTEESTIFLTVRGIIVFGLIYYLLSGSYFSFSDKYQQIIGTFS
jgi:flagellar biosynthesis protein FliR